MKKHNLPTVVDFGLDIDVKDLQYEAHKLYEKFTDVRTANPMLCMNHE